MSEPETRGAGFWVALVIGWFAIGFGAAGLGSSKLGVDGAFRVGAWVAGGHVVHDAVVVPGALLVGFFVARAVSRPWRMPVQMGLVASAVVVAVAYPALRGFGRKPGNPSVLPLDYTSAVLTALGAIWAAVFLVVAVVAVRRSTSRPSRVE